MSFPACHEKELVLGLNTKMDGRLISMLNLIYLCFMHHSSLLMGNKPNKMKLGDVAYRVISNACHLRDIDLGDDGYCHVYR